MTVLPSLSSRPSRPRRSWRRLGASVAAVAVTAALTTVAAPAHADPPDALGQGADWLAGQLADGLVHNDQYGSDDYGLSIDTALALHAAGGHAGDVNDVEAALGAHLDEYIGAGGVTYSGSVAKALVFAEVAGADPATYGGRDLVQRLEQQVKTASPVTGRLFDTSSFGDYANTIAQAYAARGLAEAGSPEAGDVLDFLLEQQCPAGYFRLGFTKDETAPDQTCRGGMATGDSPADPDATSIVVLQLRDLAETTPRAARAVGRAESWLVARQHADGSFSGGTSTDTPNANSTGLAGWALGELGHTGAASRAAVWVRQHQAQALDACPTGLDEDAGAIAYDTAALKAGRTSGITIAVQDQWRRAAAQSLPVLQWLPTSTGTPRLAVPSGYRKAGSKATLRASHATPGSALCFTIASRSEVTPADAGGAAQARIELPGGTANRIVRLTDGTTTRTERITVLGAKRLRVKSRAHVERGDRLRVNVLGLAPHERVTVRLSGKVFGKERAGKRGRVHLTRKVTKRYKLGKRKIVVHGQFKNRHGSKSVRIRR